MTLTGNSPFRDIYRLSQQTFVKLLQTLDSPAAPEGDACYAACLTARICPLFALAMFQHESGMGKNGAAKITRSWGNTRPPAFGPAPTGYLNQDTGLLYSANMSETRPPGRYLCAYGSWLDGLKSTLARLNSDVHPPQAPYAARAAIVDIFQHPSGAVWAPAGDANNPAGYLASVLDFMNKYNEGQGPEASVVGYEKLADRQLSPLTMARPGRLMWGGRPKYVTIHETDNPNAGATAAMHARFVVNGGGEDGVSFHAAVDSTESVQIMPWNAAAYHIGDGDAGEGNNTSVGLEICVNSDGDYNQAALRAVALARKLLTTYNLPIERLRYHGQWWSPVFPDVHKGCPALMLGGRQGWTWAKFVDAVNKSQAVMDAEALRAFLFATVAAEYPLTERERYLGRLLREGALLDAQNRPTERAAKFDKATLHTWEGQVVGMFREGPTSEQALLDAKKLVWY